MQSPAEDMASARAFRQRPGESLSEMLQEAVAPYVPERHRHEVIAAIEETLETGHNPAAHGQMQIFETLRKMFGDTRLSDEMRRMACSAAIGANDPQFGESYQFYADMFGVSRACIHADARDVQVKFGLKSRRDKSEAAREQSRERATARPPARVVKNLRALTAILPKL